MSWLDSALERAHPSWHAVLRAGLVAVEQANPEYLATLATEPFLPTQGRIFAAFSLPMEAVRYILIGEGPYPREASATGYCFMDGAVQALWSEKGLSKQVNRATSLRNFMKMLLVARGMLKVEEAKGARMAEVAHEAQDSAHHLIATLPQLQANLLAQGFLLLNAALVYRPTVAPIKEARAWLPFLQTVLRALSLRQGEKPTLVLWGKIAEQLQPLADAPAFPQAVAEHPYNLSFIANQDMQRLFGKLDLLRKTD